MMALCIYKGMKKMILWRKKNDAVFMIPGI